MTKKLVGTKRFKQLFLTHNNSNIIFALSHATDAMDKTNQNTAKQKLT